MNHGRTSIKTNIYIRKIIRILTHLYNTPFSGKSKEIPFNCIVISKIFSRERSSSISSIVLCLILHNKQRKFKRKKNQFNKQTVTMSTKVYHHLDQNIPQFY